MSSWAGVCYRCRMAGPPSRFRQYAFSYGGKRLGKVWLCQFCAALRLVSDHREVQWTARPCRCFARDPVDCALIPLWGATNAQPAGACRCPCHTLWEESDD